MAHMLGYGHSDLKLADEADDRWDAKWWGCYSCRNPSVVIYPPKGSGRREVFQCRVNQHAPHANSIRCPSYEMISDIDELWT